MLIYLHTAVQGRPHGNLLTSCNTYGRVSVATGLGFAVLELQRVCEGQLEGQRSKIEVGLSGRQAVWLQYST